MPSITTLEVLQGREADDAAAADGPTRASSLTPPASAPGEVGGHATSVRVMECWSCHGLTYVDFDPDAYHLYTCGHCQVVNRF